MVSFFLSLFALRLCFFSLGCDKWWISACSIGCFLTVAMYMGLLISLAWSSMINISTTNLDLPLKSNICPRDKWSFLVYAPYFTCFDFLKFLYSWLSRIFRSWNLILRIYQLSTIFFPFSFLRFMPSPVDVGSGGFHVFYLNILAFGCLTAVDCLVLLCF